MYSPFGRAEMFLSSLKDPNFQPPPKPRQQDVRKGVTLMDHLFKQTLASLL